MGHITIIENHRTTLYYGAEAIPAAPGLDADLDTAVNEGTYTLRRARMIQATR